LAATTTWKTRTITVGVATVTTIRDTYSMCNDWITAPAGKTIQIRVTALKDVRCKNGCVLAAIEPKVIADRAMTSPRLRRLVSRERFSSLSYPTFSYRHHELTDRQTKYARPPAIQPLIIPFIVSNKNRES
uniref:Polyprotein n=1 Tax=Haemonchus placei TaxID=6290 RepID=A0A0N4X0D8_HAEPC